VLNIYTQALKVTTANGLDFNLLPLGYTFGTLGYLPFPPL